MFRNKREKEAFEGCSWLDMILMGGLALLIVGLIRLW